MENTYTYTARSAMNPEMVVTFTLYDQYLTIDAGVPIEHLERAIEARRAAAEAAKKGEEEEIEEELEAEEAEEMEETEEVEAHLSIRPWLKPMVISAVERTTRPFNVADVSAKAKGGGLRLAAWVRAGGLRLAPVSFRMERVDNPEAAEAFVEELDRRKESAPRPSSLPGFMDYWISWIGAAISMMIVLGIWLRRRSHEEA